MEEYVLAELRYLIGFVEGDGIFSPGGSIANGYAINCARYNKFPKIKVRHKLNLLIVIHNYVCERQLYTFTGDRPTRSPTSCLIHFK